MSREMKRLKTSNPTKSHAQIFKMAAANWKPKEKQS